MKLFGYAITLKKFVTYTIVGTDFSAKAIPIS
jgi:hypothetical protein